MNGVLLVSRDLFLSPCLISRGLQFPTLFCWLNVDLVFGEPRTQGLNFSHTFVALKLLEANLPSFEGDAVFCKVSQAFVYLLQPPKEKYAEVEVCCYFPDSEDI